MDSSISKRGFNALHTELRPDFEIFFEASSNIWSESNPNGVFPLNMAENKLCWPMIRNKLHEILRINEIPNWVANYTGIGGAEEFLESMANFISRHLANSQIEKEHMVASAGATAVLEVATWALCDAQDVAVIPAPSYPVYTQDIGNKSNVERFDLITFHELHEVQNGVRINITHLEKTKKTIEAENKIFRLLILTRPDNPTGSVTTLDELKVIAEWCIENEVHLIVNELYGLSEINISHPEITSDYSHSRKFKSAFQLIDQLKSDYVHIVYGLSKDFAISGFRVGLIYSLNNNFLKAYKNLNAPHMVSNLTQWVILNLLKQDDFISSFIQLNRRELTNSYLEVVRVVKKLEIPYIPSRGGLFVWLDLSDMMSENSYEEEHRLWTDLYEKEGILLTPGKGFGHSKYGQFRLVYTFLQRNVLKVAMKKLENYVRHCRSNKL